MQHKILNQSFQQRDSSSSIKVVRTDTLQISKDTFLYTYKYLGLLPDGVEMELKAPREPIFEYLGKELPAFILPDLNGEHVALSDFYGKPLVLNFWFRNCTPCKKEMPRLNQIREQFQDRVSFVAICLDDLDELKGFFKYHDFDYKHLINGREVVSAIGIVVFPKNIVINREGKVSQILDALLENIDSEGNIMPGEGAELIREIEKVL
jgi:peroxiredoxin